MAREAVGEAVDGKQEFIFAPIRVVRMVVVDNYRNPTKSRQRLCNDVRGDQVTMNDVVAPTKNPPWN